MKSFQGVRIIHIPTGIVVEAVDGNTLEDNRLQAMTEITAQLRSMGYGKSKHYIPPLDDLGIELFSSGARVSRAVFHTFVRWHQSIHLGVRK